MMYDALIAPFTEFEFMRRALAGVIALSLGGAPIGVFLMLRRMSLVGDAMAHAILPGAAIGFLLAVLNLFAMTFGGLVAGFAVALLAGVVARTTVLKEDAVLAVGCMLLRAGVAKFWSRDLTAMICIAVAGAIVSGYAGVVVSFQTGVPSGPAIILTAAVLYVFSVLFGTVSGLVWQLFPGRH